MPECNAELVRRAVEAIWNQGDLALADVLFTPRYVNHGGLIPDVVQGPEAIKSAVALYRTAFPELHLTVEALRAEAEMVDLSWSARRGPPAARSNGAVASRGAALRGMTRSRCVGAQIAESWTTWDQVGVLRRLGLLPREEGPEQA